MSTFQNKPTAFTITWSNNTPNSFTNLPGSQAGGLDVGTPYGYNSRISVTGINQINSAPFSSSQSIVINDCTINFTTTDTLSTIISKINQFQPLTYVTAYTGLASNCLTLTNSLDQMGYGFTVLEGANGATALTTLGITPGFYNNYPSVYGTVANPTVSNGDTLIINGYTITFTTAGGLTLAGIVSQINAASYYTQVGALEAGYYLQLNSLSGAPWTLYGTAVTELGFTAGGYDGMPNNYQSSLNKSMANVRFTQVLAQLSNVTTTTSVGLFSSTGNYDGNSDVSTLTFTVEYPDPAQIYTNDELNPGNVLIMDAAVKRFVARGLASSTNTNIRAYDPTLVTIGNLVAQTPMVRIENINVGNVSSNIAALEQNITVSYVVSIA